MAHPAAAVMGVVASLEVLRTVPIAPPMATTGPRTSVTTAAKSGARRGIAGRRNARGTPRAPRNDDDTTLLMAQVCALTETTTPAPTILVHLVEESAQVHLEREDDAHHDIWYLDTGASNHMMGDHTVFAELDTGIGGVVKFSDGPIIDISGR